MIHFSRITPAQPRSQAALWKTMEDWRKILADSMTSPEDLPAALRPEGSPLSAVTGAFPMLINPYYLGLIRERNDPIWRQAVPTGAELEDSLCPADPLAEEKLSPVPGMVWKYPDRALLLANHRCAMYCRFCTRRRKTGRKDMAIGEKGMKEWFAFLRATPGIREVLISGGDPLLLSDEMLDWLLASLRSISSIEVIRIGSRVPCTLPQRITPALTGILKKHHPLFINTHFNHPRELTPEAAGACGMLADAGIPLGCQTVLLRGVNDDAATMAALMRGLLRMRVKPYYIFQADMSRGTDHLRTPLRRGLEIMAALSGNVSGMAVPAFAVDLPGGGGKVRLAPDTKLSSGNRHVFTSFNGRGYTYVDPEPD